jgi:hypothetical protein
LGKVPEWFWSVGRQVDRSCLTFAGFFALVTFILLSLVIVVAEFSGPADERRTLSGLLAILAIAATFSVGLWSVMALGNLIAERRGKAIGPRTTIGEAAELLRISGPMSARGLLILGLVFGGGWFVLSYFEHEAGVASLRDSLLLAAAVVVTWQMGWALSNRDSRWLKRPVIAALAIAGAGFVASHFTTNILGPRQGTVRSLAEGGLTAVIALGAGLLTRWIRKGASRLLSGRSAPGIGPSRSPVPTFLWIAPSPICSQARRGGVRLWSGPEPCSTDCSGTCNRARRVIAG